MSQFIDPRSKLLQHLDRIEEIKRGATPPPVNVEIDLTNRCNLGCELCHFGHVHSRGPLAVRRTHGTGDQMDSALILSILGDLKNFGVRSVTWTGGGEPTLHPDFDRIIGACPLPQGLYTNGTLINRERAELLKAHMSWVYVSLDQCNRDDYRRYKQVDRFEQAIAGIGRLVSAKGPATIGVGFLLNQDNWRQAESMMALALQQLGADYVQFRPAVEFSQAAPNRAMGETWWILEAVNMLRELNRRKGVLVDIDRFSMLYNWRGHPYKTCWWAQMQAVITPDAKVWTCVNRRGFGGDCIGDLTRESFEEVWARVYPYPVNDQCRVLCRGHIPNLGLNEILSDVPHKEFI